MREDSNPRSPEEDAGFQDRDLKPLRHSSRLLFTLSSLSYFVKKKTLSLFYNCSSCSFYLFQQAGAKEKTFGDDRDRTDHFMLAKHVFYLLNYVPEKGYFGKGLSC